MRKLLIGLVVLALAGVASANLLLNPSFETEGANAWSPANWDRTDPGSYRSDTGNWGPAWVYDGTWTMRTEAPGLGETVSGFGQSVAVGVGFGTVADFTIYALVNDNASFTDAYIDLGFVHAGGTDWHSLNVYSALSAQNWDSGWAPHVASFTNETAGVTGIEVWVNIVNYDGSAASSDLLFDSALLSIPEPTAVALLGLGGLMAMALRRKTRK